MKRCGDYSGEQMNHKQIIPAAPWLPAPRKPVNWNSCLFFLDKCKYNDARDIISCSVSSRGRGCWTQLKPNQGRGWVKTIMVCNELWTLELRLNRIQMGIQVKCDYNVRKSELSSEILKFNINKALIYPTKQQGWNIGIWDNFRVNLHFYLRMRKFQSFNDVN